MSKIKVDTIQSTQHATSTIGLTSTGATINGDCNATTFTGSGANLTALPAANLTGTVPDAAFPATLPTVSGANLTNLPVDLTQLDAANLTSGTIPNDRFPATLPTASGANLTNLPSANLTGALPAIDGSNLTGVGGGGSLEFVSKTEISGGNTATEINFTGLDYGFIYKIVAKNITVTAGGEPYIYFYYDGASTASTSTIIDYNILHNGITHTNHDAASYVKVYTGGYEINNWEFMMELHTGYYGYFRGTGRPNGGRDYQPTFSFFQGNLDPSNYATKRISGISVKYVNWQGTLRDFQNGTSIILYKYKES